MLFIIGSGKRNKQAQKAATPAAQRPTPAAAPPLMGQVVPPPMMGQPPPVAAQQAPPAAQQPPAGEFINKYNRVMVSVGFALNMLTKVLDTVKQINFVNFMRNLDLIKIFES